MSNAEWQINQRQETEQKLKLSSLQPPHLSPAISRLQLEYRKRYPWDPPFMTPVYYEEAAWSNPRLQQTYYFKIC